MVQYTCLISRNRAKQGSICSGKDSFILRSESQGQPEPCSSILLWQKSVRCLSSEPNFQKPGISIFLTEKEFIKMFTASWIEKSAAQNSWSICCLWVIKSFLGMFSSCSLHGSELPEMGLGWAVRGSDPKTSSSEPHSSLGCTVPSKAYDTAPTHQSFSPLAGETEDIRDFASAWLGCGVGMPSCLS